MNTPSKFFSLIVILTVIVINYGDYHIPRGRLRKQRRKCNLGVKSVKSGKVQTR